jgi:hypothetical protein
VFCREKIDIGREIRNMMKEKDVAECVLIIMSDASARVQ